MRAGFRHRRAFSGALALLALLAMLVRGVAPAGYMLAPSADGLSLTVTICTGHGAATTRLALSDGPASGSFDSERQTPAEEVTDDAPCVFAMAAPLAPPQPPPPLLAMSGGDAVVLSREPRQAPGRGLAAPPPWATGPPLSL